MCIRDRRMGYAYTGVYALYAMYSIFLVWLLDIYGLNDAKK